MSRGRRRFIRLLAAGMRWLDGRWVIGHDQLMALPVSQWPARMQPCLTQYGMEVWP